MTKIASSLPDGHGLDAARQQLIDEPGARHLTIAVVDCAKVTTDYSRGTVEPTARIRAIEVVHPEDTALARRIMGRGHDRRLGATILPIDVEDDVETAFTGRSEDITTDIQSDPTHLTKEQARELLDSLERPLRTELVRAIDALRSHQDWLTLGRARRVLQVVAAHLEENDKRLLRNEDGLLVDPATGEVVDEDTLTTADLDRMLRDLADTDEDEDDGTDEGEDNAEDADDEGE